MKVCFPRLGEVPLVETSRMNSYGLRVYPSYVGCSSASSMRSVDSSPCSGAVGSWVSSRMKSSWNSSVPGSEKGRSSSS